MIANLMTTLIMALGVATGNVSSNSYKGGNVFNKEEKIEAIELEQPQPKKAIETADIYLNWNQVNEYESNFHVNSKYYLDNDLNNNTLLGNITATSYTTREVNTNYNTWTYNATFIHITPYFNVQDDYYELAYEYEIIGSTPSSQNLRYQNAKIYLTTQELSNYIDLTNFDIITEMPEIPNQTLIDMDEVITWQDDTPDGIQNSNGGTIYVNIGQDMLTEEGVWIYIYIQSYLQGIKDSNYSSLTQPKVFHWNGKYLAANYEVVDIPNLMFTILTLPFAWYSTAFNLTVFKGTPYALNFGNLILTIVAGLILMYLIKKVIK